MSVPALLMQRIMFVGICRSRNKVSEEFKKSVRLQDLSCFDGVLEMF